MIIKTHHNVGSLLKRMTEGRCENSSRTKFESLELGLAHDLVWRHPFPGLIVGTTIREVIVGESNLASESNLAKSRDYPTGVTLHIHIFGEKRKVNTLLFPTKNMYPCQIPQARCGRD